MCARIGWMKAEGRSPFGDRAIDITLSEERDAQIVVRIGKIRPQLNRLSKMRKRFIESTDARENVADCIVDDRETKGVMFVLAAGMDVQCAL